MILFFLGKKIDNMKFKMNNIKYEIKEVDSKVMFDEIHQENPKDGSDYLGMHIAIKQVIYLNKNLQQDQKKRTLYHELMHCYIWNFLHSCDNYGEEVLCDISANSHDIIHKIVEDYFKGGNKK